MSAMPHNEAIETRLFNRARRTPCGGLVAVTEAEVGWLIADSRSQPQSWPWQPPSPSVSTLYGKAVIIVDRPPMGVPGQLATLACVGPVQLALT